MCFAACRCDFFLLPGLPVILAVYHIVFIGKSFKVGGETLVQPNIPPTGTGNGITKPLMCQLMCDQGSGIAAHKAHGLMFHSARETKGSMTVLLFHKRVGANQGIKQAHKWRSSFEGIGFAHTIPW